MWILIPHIFPEIRLKAAAERTLSKSSQGMLSRNESSWKTIAATDICHLAKGAALLLAGSSLTPQNSTEIFGKEKRKKKDADAYLQQVSFSWKIMRTGRRCQHICMCPQTLERSPTAKRSAKQCLYMALFEHQPPPVKKTSRYHLKANGHNKADVFEKERKKISRLLWRAIQKNVLIKPIMTGNVGCKHSNCISSDAAWARNFD